MIIAIRKTAWGLAPADRETEDLIRSADVDTVIRARVLEDQRSLSQNRLLFLWLTVIGKETGRTKTDLHLVVKEHYVIPVLCRDDDDWAMLVADAQTRPREVYELWVEKCIHTSDLSVRQFTEVLNEIEVDARTRGINLPCPEDFYFEALMKEAA